MDSMIETVTVTTIQSIEQMREYEVPQEVFERAMQNGSDGLYSYLVSPGLEERVIGEEVVDERIIHPVFPKTQVAD